MSKITKANIDADFEIRPPVFMNGKWYFCAVDKRRNRKYQGQLPSKAGDSPAKIHKATLDALQMADRGKAITNIQPNIDHLFEKDGKSKGSKKSK